VTSLTCAIYTKGVLTVKLLKIVHCGISTVITAALSTLIDDVYPPIDCCCSSEGK